MDVSIVNQFAGRNTLAAELENLLADHTYSRFRILMAFCRGTGLGFLSQPLSDFILRGGRVEAIVGLDLGGTSPEALEALLDLGAEAFVFGVQGDRTFHPKVCLLDDEEDDRYAGIIGSGNWTAGGLDSNFETAIRLELRASRSRREQSTVAQLERLWRTYRRPVRPMDRTNLRPLTRQLIRRIADKLPAERHRTPDESRAAVGDELFGSITASRQTPVRPPRQPIEREPTPRDRPAQLPKTLYLEVNGPETGQGREIQVPIDTLAEYFGVGREDAMFMTFQHADGSIEENRPLAMYDVNTTFRISSAKFQEISRSQRPMIVKLERTAEEDTFTVTILRRTTRAFRQAQRLLNRGGGNSKRWAIVR